MTYTVYVRTPEGTVFEVAKGLTRTAATRLVTAQNKLAKQPVPDGCVYTMVGR